MRQTLVVAVLPTLLMFGPTPARAAIIYSNGPIDGTLGANNISSAFGYQVSNSFTVGTPSFVAAAVGVGIWADPTGGVPLVLDWSIGTTAFASDVGFGTSSLSLTQLVGPTLGNGFYHVYDASIAIGIGVGAPGTYWLTLGKATSANGGEVFWDANNGPSLSRQMQVPGTVGIDDYPVLASHSFVLVDTFDTAVPEPASVTLIAVGIVGFAGYRFRRPNRVTADSERQSRFPCVSRYNRKSRSRRRFIVHSRAMSCNISSDAGNQNASVFCGESLKAAVHGLLGVQEVVGSNPASPI